MKIAGNNNALIAALAGIGAKLERVLVSASVTSAGKLGAVGGLAEKVQAILAADVLQSIHALGLAREQRGASGKPLTETPSFAGRIVGAPGEDPRCRQPIVLADDFAGLVDALDRTLDEETRFGKRLPLPPELTLEDPRYGEANYFGRAWLREVIAQFFDSNECGYVVVAADAIWGKTSFALDWYRHSLRRDAYELPSLSGWVFTRKEAGGYWVDPVMTLLGLEAEARYRRNLPHAPGKLPDASRLRHSDPELAGHMGEFLMELGAEATRSGAPAVLLVDGVDEIWGPSGEQPSTLLPGALPKRLPNGVFIVLLSRPGHHLRWQGGPPTSPHLSVDLAAALTEEASVMPAHAVWRRHIQADLEAYIERRTMEIEASGTEEALDAAQRIRALRLRLLDTAQGFVFVLAGLLAQDNELPQRLRAWQANPESIPKGPRALIAGVITRILAALDQAKNRNRLDKLDTTNYAAQVLACLALTACLRQPIEREALQHLLFDPEDGALREGAIPHAARIGPLRRKLFNEDAFETSLRFGAECFVGHAGASLPKTTAFWHPLMRECLRAAWTGVVEDRANPGIESITAKFEVPAEEALAPLHHVIAAASSQYWRGGAEGLSSSQAREARAYGLAWGPWHGAVSGHAQAVQEAARALEDPEHLQAVYRALGNQAHQSLDAALEATVDRSPPDEARLFNVRRTLAQHDAVLSNGEVSVAAMLYNDLGGHEPENSQWRRQLKGSASGDLLRRQPGRPTAFLRFLRPGGSVNHLAISPCGRWLAVACFREVVLYRVDGEGFRVQERARIGGFSDDVIFIALSPVMEGGRLFLASVRFDRVDGTQRMDLVALNREGRQVGAMQLLGGHLDSVNHVAFSPLMEGGRLYLASASDDRGVGLVALSREGQQAGAMQLLGGHTASVHHVAFSPLIEGGGVFLASASGDRRVGLAALNREGQPVGAMQLMPGHTSGVRRVAFSPLMKGGRLFLASGSWDGKVGLFALDREGRQTGDMRLLSTHTDPVIHVAFSPLMEGERFFLARVTSNYKVGSHKGDLVALDREGRQVDAMQLMPGHASEVKHVAFSPLMEGGRIFVASSIRDGNIGLVTLDREGRQVGAMQLIPGHMSEVKHVAFSPLMEGERLFLASASDDRRVGLAALNREGRQTGDVRLLGTHTDSVNYVAHSPLMEDGRLLLASASDDHKVGLLALNREGRPTRYMRPLGTHTGPVNHVAFSPLMEGGRLFLASASDDRRVGLVALSREGRQFGVIQLMRGHMAEVNHVAFSPLMEDGRLFLASASDDPRVGLVALDREGSQFGAIDLMPGHTSEVNHVAFSPLMEGGRLFLASGSWDGKVGLFALDRKGRQAGGTRLLDGRTVAVNHVAFSPLMEGGRLFVASAGWDGNVGIVALDREGRQVGDTQLLGRHSADANRHSAEVNHVAFSPLMKGGRLFLACASDDPRVGLVALDREGHQFGAMQLMPGHSSEVNHVAFSPLMKGGQVFLASATRQEVLIWSISADFQNLRRFTPVARLSLVGTGERIYEIRWNEDGRLLYVAGELNCAPVDLTLIVPDLDQLMAGDQKILRRLQ
jgi:WD40 repeat protein/stage V sporulation protein SpoVS